MKNILLHTIAILILFIFYLLTGMYISSNHSWLILIMQILIIPLYFIYHFYHKNFIVLNSIIFFSIVLIIGMVIEKDFSRGSVYPIFLISIYYLLKLSIRTIPKTLLISFIILFNSFLVFPNYFELVHDYKKNEYIGADITKLNLINENNESIILPKNGILVIDFWNTTCGICYKNFPRFEEIKKNYENRNDIKFIAINVPVKRNEDLQSRVNRINSLGYTFDKLYSINQNDVETLLNFNTYPNTIIVKDGEVIKSNLKINPKNVFINNLSYELKELIEQD